jgi:hypothetical protein
MKESEWMEQVTDLATIRGWLFVHFRPAETSHGWRTPVQGPLGKGWPDLVLVREKDQRIIFAELKAGKTSHLSPEQEAVLNVLGRAGQEIHVWFPVDLERVAEVLA